MSALLFYAIPFFILTMFVEWRLLKHAHEHHDGGHIGYEARDTGASLSMGIGHLAIAGAAKCATLPVLYGLYQLRLFDLPTNPLAAWWIIPLLVLADDFCAYWSHRAGHEIRLFWAAHVNHHSSRHYNLSTALRQSWTTPLTNWIFWAPMPLLGFSVEMVITQQAISLLYQYWLHSEQIPKLPGFGLLFNTPSHHRVHHGRNPKYIDKNYGGILIVWDRLFGTFQAEEEQVEYGIIHQIDTFNPVRIAFHEWSDMQRDVARGGGLGRKLGYLFRPPGWRPAASGASSLNGDPARGIRTDTELHTRRENAGELPDPDRVSNGLAPGRM